ncbi:LOW QUALITY PROTEIN: hypothetical protein QYF61_001569 [Mycteria americana]|uniref:Uncharacterized protein n=1 Tax=Mycteria americana TaxID=33587 RepID=A0AAN7SI21_MYCAM|nr:LOW QUALITY PROTEIN: hypothetical protein QYF61_001569 [Mycteria americana]
MKNGKTPDPNITLGQNCLLRGGKFKFLSVCRNRGGAAAGGSGALAADAAGQLDVLGHDGDALGVDGAEVGVLEEPHQVGLARLLQRHHGRALEAQVGLEVLRDLAHQPLEGQLADQQLRRLLVAPDLAQRHRAGPRCGFFTPPVAGALLRAALVASCLRGAFPPVDLRAVCFVRAIAKRLQTSLGQSQERVKGAAQRRYL